METTQLQQIREHHAKFRRQIEETGNMLRGKKMPALTEEKFSLYEKTGNRLIYENDYFERRRFLVVFGLLVSWYKRKEDIVKLEEVIEEICQENTWALPAHVDRSQKDWERTVDLFASETGQDLANILYLTKGLISDELAKKVKDLVIYRVLDSYMERPRGQWRWESFYNNWVAVCAGSLGSIALFLLDDDKEKQQAVVDRVCDTLPDYLQGMHDDGTCPEGMSYFTYGMTFFVGFARQLYEHSGGAINLMDNEKVRRIARFQHRCYLPGANTVSFSDGERRDHYRLGLTCYMARTIEGVQIPDIEAAMEFETDHCYRFQGNWQDDAWVQEYLETAKENEVKPKEWFSFLPDAQWAIWKTDCMGAAFKGGHNGEPHNHNDVGSFLIAANGEVFLADLGCGEYTKEYFADATRYDILCNRSFGHSVPIVNGKEQSVGNEYAAEYFVSETPGCVKLSFSGAYEKNASWKLVRQLESGEGEEQIIITDQISGEGLHSFEENLITQIEPVIEGNQILLKGDKGEVTITLSAECGCVSVFKEVFHNHRGKDEDVWVMRFPVTLQKDMAGCTITCTYKRGQKYA